MLCALNSQLVMAQTKVKIGELYYSFSGAFASVVSNIIDWKSTYTNDTYIIPSVVSYNGNEYTVNEIGYQAFSTNGAGGKASSASTIILPNTINYIRDNAFSGCVNLTSIVIPAKVKSCGEYPFNPFSNCSTLREIIYLSKTPPTNWTATSMTYVPDKKAYNSPKYSINYANVTEMITFNEKEMYYTGQSPQPTWTNNVKGYTASLSIVSLNGEIGEHEEWIPVTFTKGDISFTTNVVYRYTIKPAKLIAKVNSVSREYGDKNPQFGITYIGLVGGDDENAVTIKPLISTTATVTSNVGEYPITISGGTAPNYVISYEPGILTITKAPLSAKVNDETKEYGSSNPVFTIEYNGLKNNETEPAWTMQPIIITDAMQNSNVGKYTVNASNAVPINYSLSEITSGTLNIIPVPLTIKVNDAVRPYYSDNPTFSYTIIGFVNGEDERVLTSAPNVTTTATMTSNVGTYKIMASGASSPNYSFSYTNGTLTISPRTLIVSVDNYERLYNEENPEFEAMYNGFMGNDDKKSLTKIPVVKTIATKLSDVGSYPITISEGVADNYIFSYISGLLTINKAEQILSWDQDLMELKKGEQIELIAQTSSNLPIIFSIENSSIAEVYSIGNKNFLDCKADGVTQVLAIQEGNKNYYTSSRIRRIINVTSDKYTLTYMVDGDVYKSVKYGLGEKIIPESIPTKTGYKFSGWSNIPITMPNCDVTVNGTFSKNVYKLTYVVDGVTYKTFCNEYADTITSEPPPNKHGYSFLGWSEIPQVMPANDVTVTGTFSLDQYKLTFIVDNHELSNLKIEYGTAITPPLTDSEGNTVNWYTYPLTMPAYDYVIFGMVPKAAAPEKYTITYVLDGQTYRTVVVEEGAAVSKEKAPYKEGYTFNGWQNEPTTMPGRDVTVNGTFSVNTYRLSFIVDNEELEAKSVEYGAAITVPAKDGEGNDITWYTHPTTMPAHDLVVYGMVVIEPEPEVFVWLTVNDSQSGCMKIKVRQGAEQTLNITAEDGWKISTIFMDGRYVTSKLAEDGTFVTPAINSDASIIIVYEQEVPSGVRATRSQADVKVVSDGVVISNAEPDTRCVIYSTDGQQVVNTVINEGTRKITLQQGQVYILTIDGRTLKFAL